MKNILTCTILGAAALALSGCASIDTYSHSYLGSPEYPPTTASQVRLITSNPKVSDKQQRLGEIVLDVEGEPSREKLEMKLREEAAKLGADAVVVVSDRTRLVPVYGDAWGYGGDTTDFHRDIVAVAVKMEE